MEDNLEKLKDLRERAEALAELPPIHVSFTKEDWRLFLVSLSLIGAGIALASGTAGWQWAKKRLEPKYADLAEKEIAEARHAYARLHKNGDFATPEAAAAQIRPEILEAADALQSYQGGPDEEPDEPVVEVNVEVKNVFTENQAQEDVWDQSEEEASREIGKPYIISYDEFTNSEDDYQQDTLTYYSGDQVLVDATDDPIPLPDNIIGKDTVSRFGHGSKDARTVYVRNDRLRIDFEIVKSEGTYSHEVLGLEHSADSYEKTRRPRKFRGGDE